MADPIVLESHLVIEKLIKQLEELKANAIASQRELQETIAKLKGAGEESGRVLANTLGRIEAQRKEIVKLNEEILKYKNAAGKSFDPAIIEGYTKKITTLETELKTLKEEGQKATDGIKDKIDDAGKATDNWKSKLGGLLGFFKNFLTGGGLLGLITLVVGGIKKLIDSIFELTAAEKAREETLMKLNEIQVVGAAASQKAKIELDALLVVARDVNRSDDERFAALRKINDLMPEHLGNITLENINTRETNRAIDEYILQLGKKAKAQAYVNVIQEQYNELIKLETAFTLAGGDAAAKSNTFSDPLTQLIAKKQRAIRETIKITKEQITTLENSFNVELRNNTVMLDLDKERAANAADAQRAASALSKAGLAGLKEQEQATKKATAESKRLAAEEEARLKKILELEKQLAALRLQLLDEGKKKDIATENARFETATETLEFLKKNLVARTDLTVTEQKQLRVINELIQTQRQVHNKKLLDIDKKYYEDAVKSFEAAQQQIDNVLLKDEDKEIAGLEKRYDKIFEAIETARKKLLESVSTTPDQLTAGGISVNAIVKTGINAQAEDQVTALTEQLQKERLAIIQKYNLKQLKEAEDLAQSMNNILDVQGLNEEQLIRLRETNKLLIIIEFAKKRLELLKLDKDANAKEIADTIDAINKAAKGLDNLGNKEKTGDLFDFLGIDPDDVEKIKAVTNAISNLGQAGGDFINTFIEGIDRQIAAKQKLINTIEESISKQQEAVDREKELSEKGLANNLGIEQAKLSALQKSKDAELVQEKKLQKEKQALQKAQIVADGFAQTSNLVTASTDIFKATAKLGPIGVGIAIASIALMIGAFLAAKINALKAVNQAPTFRKGDYFDVLKGQPAHEQGGVGLYNEKSGKKIAELEGDEKIFIVNKGSSKKYSKILEAVNRDELKNWSIEKFYKEKSGRHVAKDNETTTVTIDGSMASKYSAILEAIRTNQLFTWSVSKFYDHRISILQNEIEQNKKLSVSNEENIKRYASLINAVTSNETKQYTFEDLFTAEKTERRQTEKNITFRISKDLAEKYRTIIEAINTRKINTWTIENLQSIKSAAAEISSREEQNRYLSMDKLEKYKSVLDAINSDKLHTWSEEKFYSFKSNLVKKSFADQKPAGPDPLISSWTVDRIRGIIKPVAIAFKNDSFTPAAELHPAAKINIPASPMQDTYSLLERIANSNDELLKLEKNREEIIEFPDKTIIRKANHTRVINKAKE